MAREAATFSLSGISRRLSGVSEIVALITLIAVFREIMNVSSSQFRTQRCRFGNIAKRGVPIQEAKMTLKDVQDFFCGSGQETINLHFKIVRDIGAHTVALFAVSVPDAARAKLAVILDPINDAKHRPKKMMTFRSFIAKYRALKLANQKGTTKHGYETNIRAHYLPEFGDMELSDITIESVQAFLNQKAIEGKAVRTLKNLKWGLSSIFVAAMKYGYMKSNPARGTDLPPEGIKERHELPSPDQLNRLIERLKEPVGTAVWLTAVTCVRPEELAFKWNDLIAERRELWVVRAVNRGKLHTPKYHRSNRPIRLTEADVGRLLALKARRRRRTTTGCFQITARLVRSGMKIFSPVHSASREGTRPSAHRWRLLRHWGATRWWKDTCRSRRRKSALVTRAPIFFSNTMPMSWTNRQTWRQRP